jgi:hypothetical protein
LSPSKLKAEEESQSTAADSGRAQTDGPGGSRLPREDQAATRSETTRRGKSTWVWSWVPDCNALGLVGVGNVFPPGVCPADSNSCSIFSPTLTGQNSATATMQPINCGSSQNLLG